MMAEKTEKERVEEAVLERLYQVIDPEIGINIVDLGLVYGIEYDTQKGLEVEMTLTTEGCPMGDVIQQDVRGRVQERFPDTPFQLTLTFDPPWDPEMVSEAGREALG